MNISLSLELEHFVRANVASGRYKSASEVVREALRLLQEADKYRQTRQLSCDAQMRELQREFLGSLFQNDLAPRGTVTKKRKAPLS